MSEARGVSSPDALAVQPSHDRRAAMRLLVGSGAAAVVAGTSPTEAADPAAKAPPAAGDSFVFAEGQRKGAAVAAADLPPGGPMVAAWAQDAATGTVRSASRLHRVLLVRLDPASLDEKTKARATGEGIVAYSGFCTHAGCPVQHWKPEGIIHCHCHGSEFDPRANGRVVTGPARRSLAGLPLKLDGERLLAAGPFVGPLGAPKA
jgi:Rieske Fe-S protein